MWYLPQRIEHNKESGKVTVRWGKGEVTVYEKNEFKESALTLNLTAIWHEKSMLYGWETLGKMPKHSRKFELVV